MRKDALTCKNRMSCKRSRMSHMWKKRHYGKVCRNYTKSVNAVTTEEESFFLGSVNAGADPWSVQLQVRQNKVCFKIDTGADVTALPADVYHKITGDGDLKHLEKPKRQLFGPEGNVLRVLGVAKETLCSDKKSATEDVYVVEGLHTALLGLPAIKQLQLVSRVNNITIETVKQQYPRLCSGLGLVRRPYSNKLQPDAVPFSHQTPRRVPLPLMGKVKEEIDRMEKMDVITRIEDPTDWCAGMVVVPKKSGAVRICVDFTKMNQAVCREKYILPSVEHTLGMLAGATVFSKLDANMGFWQVPLTEESAKYTTFITPFGRYYFNRLPFGIASAPEHFQKMMVTEVTNGLEGVLCHMDDILMWGKTQEEHDVRLHALLEKAQKAGITLNIDKCEFTCHTVKFLGHVITAAGVQPDPEKTSAVQEMNAPTNVSELRSFLGMVNQLGRFIPNLAEKDKVLRDLLSKKNHWYWGPEQQTAFERLKKELSSTPVLTLYNPNSDLKISADASSFGLGAVLLQKSNAEWAPVAYASRSMTPTERRYAQVEKEALAATWACERFSCFVLGRSFELETDHKPLVSLLG
uniref:ribonuclease H n=1 Tax=Oryzias melastigma TaxID=30732 RepID=A0A3B3DHQ9_ORYME